MITLRGLTKRYRKALAVDGVTCEIEPGRVTGFLGPNGAGKSTTMRMILGLDEPTAGTALVGGKRYHEHRYPLRELGALLDAKALHPGRSARAHLTAMARSNGIPTKRVGEVLDAVGLTDVAGKRAGTLSLGMSQRLGIAGALLGDPGTLMFDEPVNGLDLDGVRWIRDLVRELADEGRAVFVSSHLMSEMQLVADHVVVIGKGKLLADASIGAVIAAAGSVVRVRAPEPAAVDALERGLATTRRIGPTELEVTGATAEQVGDLAFQLRVRLHELRAEHASLEQAYLDLTADSVECAAVTR
ncbi:ATP-binding cassette domain-containing protein [Actinokineospora auranticolor]|uniref:ABC-2 type transport system ATP-binding protein n=1 Tax=Actinokineospora auranticolor TaxID=155976 RepID=A0A2S6GU70_9PSEU|nr:ATP-binding cassette domain-containing protein [Actinokineospora auranticolor]PPK68788.1 ABC-2 type transport system ATP-binding protein [Actinokineospora auranticolor]